MRSDRLFRRRPASRSGAGFLTAAVLAGLVAACAEPPPRSFLEFMDDKIARDGVLARCDLEPDRSHNDIECANARRAAATIALREERARREELERESERKLGALREEIARRAQAEREAAAAAARAAQEAYEAQWEGDAAGTIPVPAPALAPGAVAGVPGPAPGVTGVDDTQARVAAGPASAPHGPPLTGDASAPSQDPAAGVPSEPVQPLASEAGAVRTPLQEIAPPTVRRRWLEPEPAVSN